MGPRIQRIGLGQFPPQPWRRFHRGRCDLFEERHLRGGDAQPVQGLDRVHALMSKLETRLLDEVVIFENQEAKSTGAQSLAPDHTPRQLYREGALPARSALGPGVQHSSLQQRVEQFLFHQSELLDGKHWAAYIDLFESDGVYWMPVAPEQTEWVDSPSIFAEDVNMMQIRMGRVTH